MLFPTPAELGNKLHSAESFSRKDADFSGSASVAASCPANRINSLTARHPRRSPYTPPPLPPTTTTTTLGPPYLSQSSPLPQLWLPDAVSVVISGNKIIRLASAQQKPGKWGIILGRVCKSHTAETVQPSSLVKHCGSPLVARATGSKNNQRRLPSLPLWLSFLPVKMM